jgi:hypothetical protein
MDSVSSGVSSPAPRDGVVGLAPRRRVFFFFFFFFFAPLLLRRDASFKLLLLLFFAALALHVRFHVLHLRLVRVFSPAP